MTASQNTSIFIYSKIMCSCCEMYVQDKAGKKDSRTMITGKYVRILKGDPHGRTQNGPNKLVKLVDSV